MRINVKKVSHKNSSFCLQLFLVSITELTSTESDPSAAFSYPVGEEEQGQGTFDPIIHVPQQVRCDRFQYYIFDINIDWV